MDLYRECGPDSGYYPSARRERVAEAKMIIALAYAEMLRYMGGVPLLKHSVAANEEMHYQRNTFAETVDYIVHRCV